MAKWHETDIPNQRGRSAVVTGTGGLGLETALSLARAGCDVTIAGRNTEKGADAVSRVQRASPHATVRFEKLDLATSLLSSPSHGGWRTTETVWICW